MAKMSYKIPTSLNASYIDMEIAVQSSDGLGVKPLPLKVIGCYLISFMFIFYIWQNTVIKYGTFLQKMIFLILYVILSIVLISHDKTKMMQMELLPVLFNYIPKYNRHIFTRTTSNASAFYHIANIEKISEDGLIEFKDRSFGVVYKVVGSASILLFDSDKNAIIDRVDGFYRKIDNNCELAFITLKEAQKVGRQVYNLGQKVRNLTISDPDLDFIADEQFKVLRDHVGSEFKSIHQYMILKGDSKEALKINMNIIASEVSGSSFMMKSCQLLNYDDIIELLSPIYKGGDVKRV